jgi:anti-sigma28 factor (negative regulator of flagellin synthesis)
VFIVTLPPWYNKVIHEVEMDFIDKLTKALVDFKEELTKNVNQSYSPAPNMAKGCHAYKMDELTCSENGQWKVMEKDAKDPKLAPRDRKVKQLQSQIDAGTYKPDAGKIAGAMLQHPEKPLKKEEECHPDDPKHEAKEQEKAKKIKEKADEILDLHKK